MILPYFHETLSIYMGGIDNLIRHHDYIIAVLESVRPYPVARYWLHCHHLYVNGKKMSKSLGKYLYTGDVLKAGFSLQELRFFLIYNHYRERVNYTEKNMARAASVLKDTRSLIDRIKKAGRKGTSAKKIASPDQAETGIAGDLKRAFEAGMENDLNAREAFDGLRSVLIKAARVSSASESGRHESELALETLGKIDRVLGVLF